MYGGPKIQEIGAI